MSRIRGRIQALVPIVCFCCLAAGPAGAQNSLTIGDATATTLQPTEITVTMTNDVPVEGFILAITYDTTEVSLLAAGVSGIVDGLAEGVFLDIFESLGGFTLGVILDVEAPFDGQTIPTGTDQTVAAFTLQLDGIPDDVVVVPLDFVDGALNSPPLDNVILPEGGGEIGAPDLTLEGGTLTVDLMFTDSLTVGTGSIPPSGDGSVPIFMTNPSGPVVSYSVTVLHGPEVVLDGINLNNTITEAFAPEFVDFIIAGGGGQVSVILDFVAPFDNQMIPVGDDQLVANFVYECPDPPILPDSAIDVPLTLSPGTTEIGFETFILAPPALTDGFVTCEAAPPPVPANTAFFGGIVTDEGEVLAVPAAAGSVVAFPFLYADPDDGIEGFQLSVAFDCELDVLEGTLSIEGTPLHELAEFVTHNVDDDPTDGDGCELVVGILLDAVPPFQGQTAPIAADPLPICFIDVLVPAGAAPSTVYSIEFEDGLNGDGGVPLENLVVIENESVFNFPRLSEGIVVTDDPEFLRGDCNGDTILDLADGIFLLNLLFLQGPDGPCRAACNVDGLGGLGLEDALYYFNFLYIGGPPPPAPFPNCGTSPNEECAETICP